MKSETEDTIMSSVTIMLGAYNGQNYIAEQLDSIHRQRHSNWELIVSDDGSTDRTPEIINGYVSQWSTGKISLRPGPRNGFCKNFLSMACDPDLSSDYYAFSDQDDLWEPEKLSTAIEWLDSIPKNIPALYCGRTALVDNEGNQIGLSPHFKLPPSFRNALVQSIASGNTMVFNEAARQLLVVAGADVDVPSHDWWLYILVTGAGGVVKYDPVPHILYRQHEGNLVGGNISLRARWLRLVQLFQGRMRRWNTLHWNVLVRLRWILTEENQLILTDFDTVRNGSLPARLWAFMKSRLHRQTVLGHSGLIAAVCFRKV